MKKGILLLPLVALIGDVQAAERYDWTGFYAGANVAMSTFETDTRDYWCWYACDAPNTVEDGVTYGIQTGYNYQVDDTFVVGVELDYQTGQDSSTTVKFNQTDGVNWDSEWKSLMSLSLAPLVGKKWKPMRPWDMYLHFTIRTSIRSRG